jgi:hypothetical protein
MTQHHNHDHKKSHEHSKRGQRPLHHDWRLWVGVALAVAAMLAYVLSDDESLQPAGGDQPGMPAEASAE